jgi:hypothetical protein
MGRPSKGSKIMTPQQTKPVFDRTADNLRAKFNEDIAKIRSRPELTQVAKNARIAAATKTLRAQMASAEATANEARRVAREKNERIAFGLDDLASSPGDKATVAMAHRTALDKVSTITDPREAAALVARARTSGDETLVRALALHAHQQVVDSGFNSGDWQDVLGNAAGSRPAAIEAINALQAEATHTSQASEMFEYAIVTPLELGRATTDTEFDRIIAQDPSMGLVS